MVWGFPLSLKGKSGQPLKPKPVNNAREDKLGSSFWKPSFERRRCLIPVSAWAEAEGNKGEMTPTWYSVAGQDVFMVVGIWRPTEEWGNAYSMVMVGNCNPDYAPSSRSELCREDCAAEGYIYQAARARLDRRQLERRAVPLRISASQARYAITRFHGHCACGSPAFAGTASGCQRRRQAA